MGLLQEVEESLAKAGPQCTFVGIFATLPDKDVADLKMLLNNSAKYPASTIGVVLRKRDLKVSDETIRRHRAGKCACPR